MSTDGRGLDHLMEQNDTELDFLSAYGVDDGEKGDAGALFVAVHRFPSRRRGGLRAARSPSWCSSTARFTLTSAGVG